MRKVKNGAPISEEEFRSLQNLPLELVSEWSLSPDEKENLEAFDYNPGSVLKVTLSFQNELERLLPSSQTSLFSQYGPELPAGLEDYNLGFSKFTFLCIVMQNNNTLPWNSVLEYYRDTLYGEVLAHFHSDSIVLESVQVQQVFPIAQKFVSNVLGANVYGKLPSSQHHASKRSFLFSCFAPLIKAGKGDCVIRLPYVSRFFAKLHQDRSSSLAERVEKFRLLMQTPMIFGPTNNLKLGLGVHSKRASNPFAYGVVTNVSTVGFASNSGPLRSVSLYSEPQIGGRNTRDSSDAETLENRDSMDEFKTMITPLGARFNKETSKPRVRRMSESVEEKLGSTEDNS